MTPEGKIKARLDRALKGISGCYKFKPVLNGMGSPSLDYILCVRSNWVAIETKASAAHHMTPRQKETARQMREAGGTVLLVYDDKSLERAIRIISNMKPWHDRQKAREWSRANPLSKEAVRRAKLKYRHGITPEEYETILGSQGGCCFFCSRIPEEEAGGVLCVDHDHQNGRIRGLVCRVHNHALWNFGDNVPGFERALAYVRG